MDPFTLLVGAGLLFLFAGGKKKKSARVCQAREDKHGNMVEFVWDEGMGACIPTKAFIPPDDYDPDDYENGEAENGNGSGREPDKKPGPIDRPKILDVPDIPEEEEEEEEDIPEDTWIKDLAALISDSPKPNRFFQLYKNGPTAAQLATQLLAAKGINSGSNRIALIKCMTQIAWNQDHYTSTRVASSWGTMFNVDGENLSAAWMPRHDPAMQLLAMKKRVPRNINAGGVWLGGESKYGLIWIPRINDFQGKVICDPLAEGPPAWLIDNLKE